MCIRRETREKARQSLAYSPVSKPHTHITYMLRQCTSIVYIWGRRGRDRMVVELTTKLPMQYVPITSNLMGSNPAHGEIYLIQHYVIKFPVSSTN